MWKSSARKCFVKIKCHNTKSLFKTFSPKHQICWILENSHRVCFAFTTRQVLSLKGKHETGIQRAALPRAYFVSQPRKWSLLNAPNGAGLPWYFCWSSFYISGFIHHLVIQHFRLGNHDRRHRRQGASVQRRPSHSRRIPQVMSQHSYTIQWQQNEMSSPDTWTLCSFGLRQELKKC